MLVLLLIFGFVPLSTCSERLTLHGAANVDSVKAKFEFALANADECISLTRNRADLKACDLLTFIEDEKIGKDMMLTYEDMHQKGLPDRTKDHFLNGYCKAKNTMRAAQLKGRFRWDFSKDLPSYEKFMALLTKMEEVALMTVFEKSLRQRIDYARKHKLLENQVDEDRAFWNIVGMYTEILILGVAYFLVYAINDAWGDLKRAWQQHEITLDREDWGIMARCAIRLFIYIVVLVICVPVLFVANIAIFRNYK